MKRIAGSPSRVLLGERRPVVATGADPALPTRRTTFARIDTTAQDFSRRERRRMVPAAARAPLATPRLAVPTAGRAGGVSDDGSTGGFAERLGARAEVADDGSALLRFNAREEHLNQAGTLHGGVMATLVDTAMGAAVRSTVDDDVPATSQLTVTYLRPGKPGDLTVTARVRSRGEHLTVCDADVEQDGRSLVHAVATFALLHG
jgi:uncharacterized protein (TIGR00369 family)